MANWGALSALEKSGLGPFFLDERCHASLFHNFIGRSSTWVPFRHNDMENLEKRLQRYQKKDGNPPVIVVESVYSMDGDQANLLSLYEIALRYKALIYIDEAHAFGVWGKERGCGLWESLMLDYPWVLQMVPLGKGGGFYGAFIVGKKRCHRCDKAMGSNSNLHNGSPVFYDGNGARKHRARVVL